jgi:hypothetical protein
LHVSSSNPADGPREQGSAQPLFPLRRVGDAQDESASDHDEPNQGDPVEAGTVELQVRLANGEVLFVDRFVDVDQAKERAEALIKSMGQREQHWIFVAGRFLRPGAIISIDVNDQGSNPKWTGSAHRAATWRPRQHGDA